MLEQNKNTETDKKQEKLIQKQKNEIIKANYTQRSQLNQELVSKDNKKN